jgi:hypothetical protein
MRRKKFGGEITKRKFSLIGIAVLAVLALSALASTHAVTAGVQAGNRFQYKMNYITGTARTNIGPAVNYTVEVSSVSSNGSVVYLQQTVGYSDGTQMSWSGGYMNIETFNPNQTLWFLTAADLKADDLVWPESGMSITINGTASVGGRPTNYVILNNAYINGGYVTADVYYDQATGVPVNASFSLTGASNDFSFSYILTSTTAWNAVPEFSPVFIVLVTFTLMAATGVTVYHRKAKRPSLQR